MYYWSVTKSRWFAFELCSNQQARWLPWVFSLLCQVSPLDILPMVATCPVRRSCWTRIWRGLQWLWQNWSDLLWHGSSCCSQGLCFLWPFRSLVLGGQMPQGLSPQPLNTVCLESHQESQHGGGGCDNVLQQGWGGGCGRWWVLVVQFYLVWFVSCTGLTPVFHFTL